MANRSGVVSFVALIGVALWLCACGNESSSGESANDKSKSVAQSPPPSTKAENPQNVPQARSPAEGTPSDRRAKPERSALEGAMWEIRCLLDSNNRSGAGAIYKKYGYKDAAHWAADWQQATSVDPDWAERTLVGVLNRSCVAPKTNRNQ